MEKEDSIDLGRLFKILRRNWKVELIIIVICTAIAAGISFILPKQWESTVLVQTRSASKVDLSGASAALAMLGGGGGASSPTMNYMELMKSRTVLDPIIDYLDFPEKKRPDAVDFAKEWLDIQNTKGTNLITIAAKGRNPEEAQTIAQTVVDNFLRMQTDMNQETQSLLVKFLDQRVADAEKDSEDAGQKLADYSKEHKIYSPDDQMKAAIAQLSSFDKSIAEMRVQKDASEAQLAVANAKLEEQNIKSSSYKISDYPTVEQARDLIVAKEVELAGLQQKYTEKHPNVQKAEKELAELNAALEREVEASVKSGAATLNPAQTDLLKTQALAASNLAIAEASEKQLDELRSQQEAALGQMPDEILEYMRLQRDSLIKEEVYKNLVTQAEQSRIQAAMDSMDIQVVDPANLPDENRPVAPKKKLITAVGFGVGVLISLGLGLMAYKRETA